MHLTVRTFIISLLVLTTVMVCSPPKAIAQEKIGVIYVVHGGMDIFRPQFMWDAVVQQFAYDHNHSVYNFVIWNSAQWGVMLDANVTEFAKRFLIMYDFGYERVGGVDPNKMHMLSQLSDLEASLAANTMGLEFEVEWAGYMSADDASHWPYPRFVYYPPGPPYEPTWVTGNVTYCGEQDAESVVLDFVGGSTAFSAGAVLTGSTSGATALIDEVTVSAGSWGGADAAGYLALSNVNGAFADSEIITGSAAGSAAAQGTTHWPDCDPERFNVDGPAERLLNLGVNRIVVVDATVGGVRFSKTYDVIEKTKLAVEAWRAVNGGPEVPIDWVNDPNWLMVNSYPTEPAGWTRIDKTPDVDPSVPLAGNPNPWIADMELALLHVEGIEAAFLGVPEDQIAVALWNHALHDWNEFFDPKINDTLTLNENIKTLLLARNPTMDPANIIGIFGGIKELNPNVGPSGKDERTRPMRGETYGYAWLYESDKQLPADPWGYRYWDGLEYLKDRGAQHIVIGFSQNIVDSNLNMIEVPNQIAKEIGYKTWGLWGGDWDYASYPGVGHPFADYWGIWVDTDCGEWELAYDGGTADFAPQGILTGQTSGATAVIKWLSGTTASGTLTVKELSGTFLDNEALIDDLGGSAAANGAEVMTSKTECCFVMGGCGDPLRPYPPSRHAPINVDRNDLDPSLAFDVSEYGHLGYDPGAGPPDPNAPVQDQYTGTWLFYRPANDDPRVGQLLAKHVLEFINDPVITLSQFTAVPGNRSVEIVWETASEIDNAGFNLYRAASEGGEYTKLNDTLIAAEDAPAGASYKFVDDEVDNRKTYWYQLEDIDASGQATRHGPVSATPRLIYGLFR